MGSPRHSSKGAMMQIKMKEGVGNEIKQWEERETDSRALLDLLTGRLHP